jgi:hypothetical protein
MEKWKTQEAAFPTFPQGLPTGRKRKERRSRIQEAGSKGGALTSASFLGLVR